jgi:predicted NBD/HSP70 family sugar kinase
MKCLVLDYGGTALKYGVLDTDAQLTEQGEIPAPNHSAEEYIAKTGEIFDRFRDQVEGIAISMPGTFTDDGVLVSGGAYLHILQDVNIIELLHTRCPLPIALENDGKAAALAEAWNGNLKDCQDGIAIILGTGIGGGIIKDRRIYRGRHAAAGEFSYIITGGKPGVYNCATYTCSTEGFVERAAIMKGANRMNMYMAFDGEASKAEIARLRALVKGPQYPDMEMNGFSVFKLLEEGDPDVAMLYEDLLDSLSQMIVTLAHVCDPDRFVIGGGISKEPRLIADLQKKMQQATGQYVIAVPGFDVQPCYYRSSANLYGAMFNWLQKYHPELVH